MAIKKSRFLILLLLYGLVMVLLGFILGVSTNRVDTAQVGDSGNARSEAGAASVAEGSGAQGEEGAKASDNGDDEKDEPIPFAELLVDTGPVELPQALLVGQYADADTAQAVQQRLENAHYEGRIVQAIDDNQHTWYLVILDAFEYQPQLQQAKYQLESQQGISTRIIRRPPKAE